MQIFRREFVQKHELTWGHGQHRWIEQRLAYRIGKCGKIVLCFFFVGVENQPTFGSAALSKALPHRYHTLCMVHKVRRIGEPEELAAGFATVAEVREARKASARTTRQDRELYVPRSRTEMEKRRFSCRGPMLYNTLPSNLTDLPVPLFSRHLRRHLSAGPAAPD